MSSKIDLTRLYVLLFMWFGLLVAPAALELSGVFGHGGLDSSLDGPMIGIWIGGYLAQFAIFMWISRIVDVGFVAWFAASLLPWALDWTTPVSPFFALVWAALAIVLALRIAGVARRDEELREHGVHASGLVLEVYRPYWNVIVNGAYIQRKLRLRIQGVTNVAPYEATFTGLYMFGNVPSVGDRIPLLVDATDPQRFEYDDGASAGSADSESSDASGSGADDGADDDSGGIADQLGKLAKLHAQGKLSDAEFDAAKKKLLT
jgi:hypothetical protein